MITYHNDYFCIETKQFVPFAPTFDKFSWSVFPTKQKTFANHISIGSMYVVFTVKLNEFADIVDAVSKCANSGISREVGEEIALHFQGTSIRIYSHQWGVSAKLTNADWVDLRNFLNTILKNGNKTSLEHFNA